MGTALIDIPKIDIYFDGSAIDGPPERLGAGWLRVANGNVVHPVHYRVITEPSPTTNRSLFAETKAATWALLSVPKGKEIRIFGDHNHVLDFMNRPEITRKMRREDPGLVPHFEKLRHAVARHKEVQAIEMPRIKDKFGVAVHNLAVEATGANKHLWHAELDSVFNGPMFHR